ncbi:hypothetical protein [Streptomyces sp. TLI_105]|uniref:hypothetical protein n=1 Tax=Streptomyces sp. TLI_105 TaxID=1881019 RepID=UPI000895C3D4|nr:hypothetical protein [Streptomyces sp. TLI_105]SEB71363.1 hypothetical protein SAMN05428939_0510 [Streptomyces sp. TLI_105]
MTTGVPTAPPTRVRPSAMPVAGLLRTAALTLCLWASAGAVTAVSYLLPSADWIAIGLGVVLFLLFGILLHVVHRGVWLVLLAALPALLVLVGAVQYPPELALERYGVRESVVVTDDSAASTGGKNHRLTLRRADGQVLAERLVYRGTGAPKVGDPFREVLGSRRRAPYQPGALSLPKSPHSP